MLSHGWKSGQQEASGWNAILVMGIAVVGIALSGVQLGEYTVSTNLYPTTIRASGVG